MSAPTPPKAPEARRTVTTVPPFDSGNALLSIVPSQLTTSVQETPAGQRLAVTVRTVDATLTVFLDRDEVDNWTHALRMGRDQMHGLIVPGG